MKSGLCVVAMGSPDHPIMQIWLEKQHSSSLYTADILSSMLHNGPRGMIFHPTLYVYGLNGNKIELTQMHWGRLRGKVNTPENTLR